MVKVGSRYNDMRRLISFFVVGTVFGIIMTKTAEIGLVTPPLGMNLFVMQGVAKDLSAATIIRGIGPFIAADVVRLAVIILLPALTLWLPDRL